MSIAIELSESELSVVLSGASTVLALKSHLSVPLSEVSGVEVMSLEDARAQGQGIKGAGAHIPGVFRAGSYRTSGSWQFWYVGHADRVLVIDLSDDRYERLVLEVDDPQAMADRINAARGV